jgi:RNA-directed DNA polymerase
MLEKAAKNPQEKWHSLIDKVYKLENLLAAFAAVKRNDGAPGIDQIDVERYEQNLLHNLQTLQSEIRDGTYKPQALRRVLIDKTPGSKEKRPLGIPCVRDRVAQKAVVNVIEPIFDAQFSPRSYGFRFRMGCKDALREVEAELYAGKTMVVDADLKSYFDTIPKDRLMSRVEQRISDSRMLKLIRCFLDQGVMEELKYWEPEAGTPQGGVISPLLANLYLDPLDKLLAEQGVSMIRYADDFVLMCRTRDEADKALATVRDWCEVEGLTLHPDKTKLVDMGVYKSCFDFLGYRFYRSPKRFSRLIRDKSLDKMEVKLQRLTPRNSGLCMKEIVKKLNRSLRGFYNYFKHSSLTCCLKPLDEHLRMRLRRILHKREKRKGFNLSADNKRWGNDYFDDLGLFSLEQAKRCELRSLRGKR